MNDDAREALPKTSESVNAQHAEDSTFEFYNAANRRHAWSGETEAVSPTPIRQRRRRVGSRGLLVLCTVLCVLLIVSLLLVGFFRLVSDIDLPAGFAFGIKPRDERQQEQQYEEYVRPPNLSVADAPTLMLHSKEEHPLSESSPTGLTIPEIAELVSPAVVGIVAEGRHTTSHGSGIILSENGYIVTNAHVVEAGGRITVHTADEKRIRGRLIGSDRKSDLAVLKVDTDQLPYALFGNSDEIVVGELAVAIGNPMSMELFGSVTAGIISAVNRRITFEDRTMTLIQTDAAINPGNSGGALVNAFGQVVGINSVKVIGSRYEGIGFAIPTSSALPIIESLIKNGYVPTPLIIGIVGETLTDYYADQWNVPVGVYVHSITEGTDAANKDIQPGDIIIAIDETPIANMAELNAIKNTHTIDEPVLLTIYRDGQTHNVSIFLTETERE